MQIKQKNNSRFSGRKKILLASLAVVLIGLGGAATYIYAFDGDLLGWNASRQSDKSTATEDQKKEGERIKQESVADTGKNQDQKSQAGGSEQPSDPTPIPGSTKKSVDVIITAAAQNGTTLQIRSLISAVTNSGTCTLALSKTGAADVVVQANIVASSNSSNCQGFDVPVAQLSTGSWKALITFSNNELTGSVSKTVDVKK